MAHPLKLLLESTQMRALILCSLLLSAPASARGSGLLLVPMGEGTAELSSAARGLESELAARRPMLPLKVVGVGGAKELEGQVSALLQQAKVASQRFAESEALSLLNKAEQLVRGRVRELLEPRMLLDVLLARARLLGELGRTATAREVLTRIATIAPQLELDAGTFPPAMQRLFKQVKSASQGEPPARLRVDSVPRGAEILVDGVLRGRAPITLQLPRGEHLVAAGRRGASRAELIELTGQEQQTLSLVVPRLARDDEQLKAVGVRQGVEWVATLRFAAEAGSRRLVARLVASHAGSPPSLLRSKEGLALAASVRDLAQQIAAATEGGAPAEPTSGGKPFFKRWWFWTVVGVVAAGAGVTTAVLLSRDDPGVRLRFAP